MTLGYSVFRTPSAKKAVLHLSLLGEPGIVHVVFFIIRFVFIHTQNARLIGAMEPCAKVLEKKLLRPGNV